MRKLKELFVSKIVSSYYLPSIFIFIFDVCSCIFAFIFSYLLSADIYYYRYSEMNSFLNFTFIKQMLFVMVVQVISFVIFRTYARIIRFSTFNDVLRLFLSCLLTFVVVIGLNQLSVVFFKYGLIYRLSILFYSVTSFIILFIFRLSVKLFYDIIINKSKKNMSKVVIYGTQSMGISIAQMLMSSTEQQYKVVGFLNDETNATNKYILGLPVFSTTDKDIMLDNLKKNHVESIIVSPLKIKELDRYNAFDIFIENNIHILVLPNISKMEDIVSKVDVEKNLRNIQIEDLLYRDSIDIDITPVKEMINNKVVLVTGAAGSIGSEIVNQVLKLSPQLLIMLDNAETPMHNLRLKINEQYKDVKCQYVIADVRMKEHVKCVFEEYHPEIVFHAAAYKHVPLMEENPSECIIANVLGTKNLADLSVVNNVKSFIMVSTDKAVNPTNVMGCSKRIAEIYVQSLFKKLIIDNNKVTKFITTRFGNVLGSNGSVIPLFKEQIAKGGPITVTHPDIIRYFMSIPEACKLVLEAATLGHGGEIFIFDMGQPVKIKDLALKKIHLAGLEEGKDINIQYTGLRPGEKLYEELLNVKEKVKKTPNEKIMIADVQEYCYDQVLPIYEEIINTAFNNDNYNVVRLMKQLVPEYKSQNSIYESIDKEMNR